MDTVIAQRLRPWLLCNGVWILFEIGLFIGWRRGEPCGRERERGRGPQKGEDISTQYVFGFFHVLVSITVEVARPCGDEKQL